MTSDKEPRYSIRPETVAARADGVTCPLTGAVAPPIHTSTNYVRDADYEKIDGRYYSRDENPTYDAAEAVLARLEGGASARLFASGMAAISAVFQALRPGDRVVVPRAMYYGTARWLEEWAEPWGLKVTAADTTSMAALGAAIVAGSTRLVYVETPANPFWSITDIAAAARLAHDAGAILVVDSTVATPVLTRPLALGADLVVHSATKYLNGHGDVVAGALVTAAETPLWERIGTIRAHGGAVLGPFEAWLLLRGMRTLYLRVRQASASALRIARHLEAHPAVMQVLYPGLPGFAGHDLATRQMEGGFGGMLSVRVHGGEAAALAVVRHVDLFVRATSLGGVESLIEHRATIEGPGTEVPADLLRLSVGCEAVEDLIADLDQALAAAGAVTGLAGAGAESRD